MAGRRGARSGRGWDALPPRTVNRNTDELAADGELRGGVTGRGNASRRPRSSPDSPSSAREASSSARETSSSAREAWPSAREASSSARETSSPEQTESERAREICLRQLAVRPRTRAELAKVLARKEISAEVIGEVLDRYDEVGIIDDAAFARAWVSSRHHGRGLARRALANELRQRGVDAEVVGEALETLDEDEEAATARALVDRKLRTATGTPDAVFRRLVGMLARKGYPAGVAIRAVKDALAEEDGGS